MKSYNPVLAFTFSLIICSCPFISVFSPEAYKQAVNLKVESLELMSFATEPYSDFSEDVVYLQTD